MPGVDILQSISTTRGLRACTVEVLFIFHLKMVKLSNSFEAIKKGRRERCYLYWGSNTCIVIPFTGWPKSEKHSGITADTFQYNVLHNAFIVGHYCFFRHFRTLNNHNKPKIRASHHSWYIHIWLWIMHTFTQSLNDLKFCEFHKNVIFWVFLKT